MSQNHDSKTPNNLAAYCWSIADLLRGDFKQSQYGRIILPFTLLRRLEGVLEESKEAVLTEFERVQKLNLPEEAQDKMLLRATKSKNNPDGLSFFNTSKMDLSKLGENGIKDNLSSYIQSFSKDAREIFEYFNFGEFIGQLNDANLLFKVVQKVRATDLSSTAISNHDMGLVFEELIRRFAEGSNETAGEHFTPRDIVRLTTSLVFMEDDEALTKPGIIRTIYDPTAGTGGFLSLGMEYVHELNPLAVIKAFGQEINPESYAICKACMLIQGQDVTNIKLGNTLTNDKFDAVKFDYMLSNPPFGVDWKKIESEIKEEHIQKGYEARFGPGLPRVSDGSLLFLLHLISKLRDTSEGGGRIGFIVNGSCLTSGDAGSGESEIRRFLVEEDLLETIVVLPEGMFYNTGIKTYLMILSNIKTEIRKHKTQVIDASELALRMRKREGSKSNYFDQDAIAQILEIYSSPTEHVKSKLINGKTFGYRKVKLSTGNNTEFENVPLEIDIDKHLSKQLAGIYSDYDLDMSYVDENDRCLGKIGYSFNLNLIGQRESEGKQFRSYFEEVKKSEKWNFCFHKNQSIVHFKTTVFNSSCETGNLLFFKIRNPSEFDLDYLKCFFNSDNWKEWLVIYSSGAIVNKLNKYELLRKKIQFPNLGEQKKIVEILDSISIWNVRLKELRNDVWKNTSGSYVAEKYRLPVGKDLQEQIVDIAPYPIANIIHHYQNIKEPEYKSRYELILKLFECLAIFLVSILVPYIDKHIELGAKHLLLNGKKGNNKNQLKNASFGKWVFLLGEMFEIFKQNGLLAKATFVENLLNETTLDCFRDAVNIRNETSGHGSYPTQKAARETLLKVEKLYEKVMGTFYELFEKHTLIRPINCTWNGEYYTHQVDDFRGLGCYPFGLKELKNKTQLISNELYLMSDDGGGFYELFPFLRLIDLDGDSGLEAFYFYSRKVSAEELAGDNDEFQFISHQQVNKQSQLYTDARLTSIFK